MFADYKIRIPVQSGSEFYYNIWIQVRSGSEFFDITTFFFVMSVTNVTINILNTLIGTTFFSCSRLEPTLRLVLLTYGPVTDVTIDVISWWPPFNF